MDKVISRANNLKYSSLNYVDMEDIKETKLIIDDREVIFMYQRSTAQRELYWEAKSGNSFQLFWAADSKESFLNGLNKSIEYIRKNESDYNKVYIEFIPSDFLGAMEHRGFNIVSEWVDYWNLELSPIGSKSNNINIRTINERDVAMASRLTKSCTGYSRGFIGQSKEIIKEWVNTENSYLFLGEINRNLVGLCFVVLYGFDSDKGTILWIRELVVDPKYHSRGIGRNLIEHGINWGIQNGAKRSFLAVDTENTNAISLYESLGYKREDERGQINMELAL